jgi:hypothetical protein
MLRKRASENAEDDAQLRHQLDHVLHFQQCNVICKAASVVRASLSPTRDEKGGYNWVELVEVDQGGKGKWTRRNPK